jgi:hypothetical protein
VGESVKRDLKRVRRTLEKALPPESLVVEEISGQQLYRGRIDWSIKNLQPRITSDDTVFCYVATQSEFTLEPLFVCSPTGDRMSRGLLRQRLELLTPKPRLIVLLTDSRNSHQPFKDHWLDYHSDEHNYEVGRSLFQLPSGLIDWSSDKNGRGRATEEEGGELTRAWCLAVAGSPNAPTTWASIEQRTTRLNRRLDPKAFEDNGERRASMQDPSFSPDLQKRFTTLARLGVIPREVRRNGKTYIQVEAVFSGSPVTNLYRDSGRYTLIGNMHGIAKFNDKPVQSIEALEDEVLKALATATIEVFRVERPDVKVKYELELDGHSHPSSDDRAGVLWGLRLKPVDVSSGNSSMVVECVVPGSPADSLEDPNSTLMPGDRLSFTDKQNQDPKARWNDPTIETLQVDVFGPNNKPTEVIKLVRKQNKLDR